jgi:hypothetical protein
MPNATKPRLLVFLGAGASVNLGIPSTGALTTAIFTALRSMTSSRAGMLWPPVLPSQPSEVDLLQGILNQAFPPGANFEHALHAIEALVSLHRTWESHTAPRFRVVEGYLCGGPRGGMEPCFNSYWLIAARDELYRSLHAAIAQGDQAVQQQRAWPCLAGFLRRLNTDFELHVATTNYDTIVEQAIGLGATEQGFDPVSNESVSRFCRHLPPAPRLLHLHGSIQFGYRPGNTDPNRFVYEDEFEDLYWHQSAGAALSTWFGRSNQTSQAGRHTVVGPVITGLQKPDKLLAEPYLSYFRHFEDLVATIPRILLVGHGFGDVHINAALSRLTKWHGAQRRIVAVDYWPEDTWAPSSCWEHDKNEFFHHVARWSEQSDAMNVHTFPDPWQPSGPGAGCVRVYFRGFESTVQRHANAIVQFLQ